MKKIDITRLNNWLELINTRNTLVNQYDSTIIIDESAK